MHRLSGMYFPITGTPFQCDETYTEVAPCAALKPYVRCFWGTKEPVCGWNKSMQKGIVIPDTCMDIIFDINYTKNTWSEVFCCLDDRSEITQGDVFADTVSTFGIRFYAWTACLFTDMPLDQTKNGRFSCDAFVKEIKRALMPVLLDHPSMEERIMAAECLLLKKLQKARADANVLNAVYRMLETQGREKINAIENYTGVSRRSLERAFQKQMGISPKTFSSLVRYQMLWQEMVFQRPFDILDAVEKYGYTDQAHLLHDFHSRHQMSPKEAIIFADSQR